MKRRFDRIYSMMESKLYMKNEDNPENKEIFICGFKHNKTEKIDIFLFIGCESDELNENDKMFNFWSTKFINEDIEMRKFKKKQDGLL